MWKLLSLILSTSFCRLDNASGNIFLMCKIHEVIVSLHRVPHISYHSSFAFELICWETQIILCIESYSHTSAPCPVTFSHIWDTSFLDYHHGEDNTEHLRSLIQILLLLFQLFYLPYVYSRTRRIEQEESAKVYFDRTVIPCWRRWRHLRNMKKKGEDRYEIELYSLINWICTNASYIYMEFVAG